mgnify:CR=1 FL=1
MACKGKATPVKPSGKKPDEKDKTKKGFPPKGKK